jgi:hypothetical protein
VLCTWRSPVGLLCSSRGVAVAAVPRGAARRNGKKNIFFFIAIPFYRLSVCRAESIIQQTTEGRDFLSPRISQNPQAEQGSKSKGADGGESPALRMDSSGRRADLGPAGGILERGGEVGIGSNPEEMELEVRNREALYVLGAELGEEFGGLYRRDGEGRARKSWLPLSLSAPSVACGLCVCEMTGLPLGHGPPPGWAGLGGTCVHWAVGRLQLAKNHNTHVARIYYATNLVFIATGWRLYPDVCELIKAGGSLSKKILCHKFPKLDA